ncbi:MAG: ATPase, partial [Proteobacteria bacterium]|nr:ATPase [Pseudomonadota bacterium]
REIFAIHIAKRKLTPENFNIEELAVAAEGYSGSEIEQAIVGGMYRALGAQETPVTRHVIEELAHTRPLSILMGEKIAALRLWARDRTSPADSH